MTKLGSSSATTTMIARSLASSPPSRGLPFPSRPAELGAATNREPPKNDLSMGQPFCLVGFVGTYSNVEAVDRVRRLLPKLERLATEARPRRAPAGLKRREPAPILRAVMEVLEAAGTPMRAVEVHRAVEELRGEPVAWSSVKDCLASNARPGGRLTRVARGRYVTSEDCR